MRKNIPVPIFFAAIILSSCSQYYYMPNSQNVPLFSKKNELTGSVNFYPPGGTGSFSGRQSSGGELQTAYAVGNHLAVQINAGDGSGMDKSDINDNAHGGGGYFEGGVGYFLPFGTQKRFVFETYSIFSLGWMNTTYTGTGSSGANGSINAGMKRLAIQPSIGFKAKHFEIAFSLRAGGVNYSGVRGNLSLPDESNHEINQQDYLNQNKKQFFIEPAITMKAGWPSVKGQLQIGESTDETNSQFPYVHNWFSIGLNFNIYVKKEKAN